jgi:hypothetical protein
MISCIAPCCPSRIERYLNSLFHCSSEITQLGLPTQKQVMGQTAHSTIRGITSVGVPSFGLACSPRHHGCDRPVPAKRNLVHHWILVSKPPAPS